MLKRAFDAGVPAAWVTGESVYGDSRQLRRWLEEHEYAHVLAVSGKEYVWPAGLQQQVKTILATLGLRIGAGCVPALAPKALAGITGGGSP